MNILFVSQWFPCPATNGSKLRIFHMLRGLAQQHEIALLSFADQPDVNPSAEALRDICREVHVVAWKPFTPGSWRARFGFLSLTPRSVLDTFSPEMASSIQHFISRGRYDLVIASQNIMASYGRYFRGLPALFEEIEVATLYEQFTHAKPSWKRVRYGLTWAKHRRYLANSLRHFRAGTVVSERERQLVRRAIGDQGPPIEVVPNCVNVSDYADVPIHPRPNTLVFTGSFGYLPNYQAMTWFLSEVYPLIQAQVSEVHLTITGDHKGYPLPAVDGVSLTGFVDDVRPLIASAWVALAPIWTGGGTRLKILEAVALRTPVVATSKGAEGLAMQHDQHLLIADTPEKYAEAIIRLFREPGLRQHLAENAFQLVCEKYDWAGITPLFLDLVERVAVHPDGS